MNATTSLALAGIAALLSLSRADAATTYSPEIVAQNLTITGAGAQRSRQTVFSLPITRAAAWQGAVAAVEAGTGGVRLRFDGVSWDGGQFSGDAGPHMIEVVSGARRGARALVRSSEEDGLVLESASADIAAPGDLIRITPCYTLADIMGRSSSEVVVQGGLSLSAADEVTVSDADSSVTCFFFSHQGYEQWYDSYFNDAGSLPLMPTQSLLVRRKQAADTGFTVIGFVQDLPPSVTIREGVNVLAVPGPSSITLQDLSDRLYTGDPDTGLRAGTKLANADEVSLLRGGATLSYFYFSYGGYSGWFDTDFNPADSVAIQPGQGFIYRRKGGPLTLSLD